MIQNNRSFLTIIRKPDGNYVAVSNLKEVQEPMHSGYVDEENALQAGYYRKLEEYKNIIQSRGVPCDRLKVESVIEQYSLKEKGNHYEIKGITKYDFCGIDPPYSLKETFVIGEKASSFRQKQVTTEYVRICFNPLHASYHTVATMGDPLVHNALTYKEVLLKMSGLPRVDLSPISVTKNILDRALTHNEIMETMTHFFTPDEALAVIGKLAYSDVIHQQHLLYFSIENGTVWCIRTGRHHCYGTLGANCYGVTFNCRRIEDGETQMSKGTVFIRAAQEQNY